VPEQRRGQTADPGAARSRRIPACLCAVFLPLLTAHVTFFGLSIDIIQRVNVLWSICNMKTLNIVISDIEYDKFGIKSERLAFSDFIDMVSKELMRQKLHECIELADKYGLSSMYMEEIANEVNAARNNA
jgi:predicted CopG family antitoxin